MSVAVLLPVFNCEDTINQTIESLLSQSYSDFNLYVINNNCKDNTIDLIRAFKDARLKIYDYNAVQKCSAALNYGLDIISETFICRADGDDVYHKNYIKNYINELKRGSSKIVYGSYKFTYFDQTTEETERITDTDLLIWRLMFFNTVDHNVGYVTHYIKTLGQYNNLLHSEDYDLWLRSILYNPKSIKGITSRQLMCECYKSKKCMTVRYNNTNELNVKLSADFIRKFLNTSVSYQLIAKIKKHEKLNSSELIIANNLLSLYCKKLNINNMKFKKYEKDFQFYV